MIFKDELYYAMNSMDVNISIQCEAFKVRPTTYFESIWKDILKREDDPPRPYAMVYGKFDWKPIRVTKDEAEQIGNYLKHLFNEGYIKAGAW